MGKTSGVDIPGGTSDHMPGRYRSNKGSFDSNRGNMEAGRGTRYLRKHPLPSLGDRFGMLTVVGFNKGPAGGNSALVTVQCDCGAAPHAVYDYNLRKGRSTRCNVCAKKKAGEHRKTYWKYASIVPDDDVRRSLLNRISACFNRCHNPKDKGYPNYGGRGIHVFEAWRTDRAEFLRYLATLPGYDAPRLDIDRIDVDKGYHPGNLRFVTRKENSNNKRSIRELQQRIADLEAHVRYLECGSA